uniref:Uncharacterized protein n=1 Tax=Rhizophora mucronata TaxID=61149 RepID=A0A2P2M3L4_RHIMU
MPLELCHSCFNNIHFTNSRLSSVLLSEYG